MSDFITLVFQRIADFIKTYREEIVAVGTIFLAVFAWGSVSVSRKQTKLTKTLERAFLAVNPLGIRPFRSDPAKLVGYVKVVNVGRLPAKEVEWFIDIKVANGSRVSEFPTGQFEGDNFLPRGVEMIEGSSPLERDTLRNAPPRKRMICTSMFGERSGITTVLEGGAGRDSAIDTVGTRLSTFVEN
jgi:hypothetical protein